VLPVDGAAVAPKHKHKVKHVPEEWWRRIGDVVWLIYD
jgi:hypothetical protein